MIIPKIIWIEVFNGDKEKIIANFSLVPPIHWRGLFRELAPDERRAASKTQHVVDEICPMNVNPVTISETRTEPKAEENTNPSAELAKFRCHIFLVTTLPALRKASMTKRKRKRSIINE